MNRHGTLAMEYARTYRPGAYSELENPQEHFAAVGLRVATRIGELAEEMLLEVPIEQRAGQRPAVRTQAQEIVYQEEIYLPAEPGTEHREM